jgi:exopolysaccharide biosynthesis protein
MKKFFLLFTFLLAFSVSAKPIHPYHVGSVEINYNTKTKTFEISAKFFLDDLENSLNAKYNKTLHFGEEKSKAGLDQALENYFAEYFKLKSNNKFLKINYLGFEEDKESVNVYLESEATEMPKKVETAVSLLYSFFDDQMNIVHIIVNGERKSSKLNYPDRYLYQIF